MVRIKWLEAVVMHLGEVVAVVVVHWLDVYYQ